MNEQENNNLIPILSLEEIHYNKVYLSKNDIEQIQSILSKLNVQYIHKALILSSFMYDCDPNNVLSYCQNNNKGAKNLRQHSNIRNARYIWINLLIDVGCMTINDISKYSNIPLHKIKRYVADFKRLALFGTLLLDKYNAAKEVLLNMKT